MSRFKTLLITSALGLAITGCIGKNFGDDEYRLAWASQGKDVMWVPSKTDIVHRMLAAAQVTSKDVLYDLGSGDGIIPIEAAKKYGVRAVGIEYNPELVALSQRNASRAGVADLVSFKKGDIFIDDFSEATVVTLYLGENLNTKLMPRLLQMPPGTRVVSNTFRMESWVPDEEIRAANGEVAFLWVVPGQIQGRWELSGVPNLARVTLDIRQKKQFFDVTIFFDDLRVAFVENAQIKGRRFSFEFSHSNEMYRFQGVLIEDKFEGFWTTTGKTAVTGRRIAQ